MDAAWWRERLWWLLVPVLVVTLGAALLAVSRRGAAEAPAAAAPAASGGRTGGEAFVADGPPDRAVLWAVGDGPDGDPEPTAVGDLIRSSPVDRLLYLGDVYEDLDDPERLTDPTYEGSYAYLFTSTYGDLAAKTAPTVGNHEWDDGSAPGYDAYWSSVHGRAVQQYYAFRTAGWEVLSLNSELGREREAAQSSWLDAELAEPGTCRLAFWHRPRFSAGRHGDERNMDAEWRRLQGHAALVVSGHDHDMQQLRAVGGIVQLVSGAGGRSRYAVDRDDPRLVFADDRHDGAVRIELSPGSARFDFVAVSGEVLHSDTVRCAPLEGSGREGP